VARRRSTCTFKTLTKLVTKKKKKFKTKPLPKLHLLAVKRLNHTLLVQHFFIKLFILVYIFLLFYFIIIIMKNYRHLLFRYKFYDTCQDTVEWLLSLNLQFFLHHSESTTLFVPNPSLIIDYQCVPNKLDLIKHSPYQSYQSLLVSLAPNHVPTYVSYLTNYYIYIVLYFTLHFRIQHNYS